jgi:FKBP-type peptidyl-prolyl cis-trans isomerase FklB
MKYATLALMGLGLAIGSSMAQGQAPASKGEPEMKTLEQKFAYALGMDIARQMKQQNIQLDPDLLARGIRDTLADKPALNEQQIGEVKQAFQKMMMAKQAAADSASAGPEGEKNLKEGQAFLAANKSKPGVTTLPSGVQYKVIKSGTGKTPKLSDTVLANYKGTLVNGSEFDSSAKNGGPIEFPVTGVIPGWTEILQQMKVGDKWQVFIPAELAYGARRRGPLIGPNSALIFEMELVDIVGSK